MLHVLFMLCTRFCIRNDGKVSVRGLCNFQLFLFFVMTFGVTEGWLGSGGFGGGYSNGNWNFKGYGSIDFGNFNVGVGGGFSFKRSIDQIPRSYDILIQANQCHFDMYDKNGDGIITKEEILRLFVDDVLGKNLFNDLNVKKGDKGITKSEFKKAAPKVIKGCAKE